MAGLSGSYFPEFISFDVAPTTGSTTTFPPGYNAVIYTNSGTIAAQTLDLPASPSDGMLVNISNFAAITALTLSPTVAGAPSGLTAGQGLMIKYGAVGTASTPGTFTTTTAQWYVFS